MNDFGFDTASAEDLGPRREYMLNGAEERQLDKAKRCVIEMQRVVWRLAMARDAADSETRELAQRRLDRVTRAMDIIEHYLLDVRNDLGLIEN